MGVIIDKNADEAILNELEGRGAFICRSFEMKSLPQPVNTHPDMQIHFASRTLAFAAPSAFEHYRTLLPDSVRLICGAADPGSTYPYDCAYNIARVGNRIIGNFKYTDSELLNYYSNLNYTFIDVKQGYTKCNLCTVDDSSAITEDEGIFRKLTAAGVDVLKLPAGEIELCGFDHGFIGGASGFLSENTLAFFGDFSKNSYYEKLKKFVLSKKVDIIFLSSTKPADYGSLLYF